MWSKVSNTKIVSKKSLSFNKSASKKEHMTIPLRPFLTNKNINHQRKNSIFTKINPKSAEPISLKICSKNTKIDQILSKTWLSMMTCKSKEALWSEMIPTTKIQEGPRKKAFWKDCWTQPNPPEESTVKKVDWSNSSEENTHLVIFDFLCLIISKRLKSWIK